MARRAAIAFDIDGVFKYGREWSEHGLDALKRASAAGISYVFVTNGGGGLTEGTYGSHPKEKVLEAGGGRVLDAAAHAHAENEALMAEVAGARAQLLGERIAPPPTSAPPNARDSAAASNNNKRKGRKEKKLTLPPASGAAGGDDAPPASQRANSSEAKSGKKTIFGGFSRRKKAAK